MRKLLGIISCFVLILVGGFVFAACGSQSTNLSVSANKTEINLVIGEESETQEVEFVVEGFGKGSGQLNFSVEEQEKNYVSFSSNYKGDGKTTLTVIGLSRGTATIVATSLQGNKTCVLKVNVIQPLESLNMQTDYAGKLYVIKGEAGGLKLNQNNFWNFVPVNTNQTGLNFSFIGASEGCLIENGILRVEENCSLSEVTIKATSTANSSISVEFVVKILSKIKVVTKIDGVTVSGAEGNNFIEIYQNELNLTNYPNSKEIVLEIIAQENESLKIEPKLQDGDFDVSLINKNGNSFTYLVQANSVESGKIDKVEFVVSYANFNSGESNHKVKSEEINISSYNLPQVVNVNGESGEVEIELFEKNVNLGDAFEIQFSVLPTNLKNEAKEITIWAKDFANLPFALYKMNETRTGYDLVFGTNAGETTNQRVVVSSGTKLFAVVNENYSSENKTAIIYSQSSIFYTGDTIDARAITTINFAINENAKGIYLAGMNNGVLEKNSNETIFVELGEQITQYFAIDPNTFVLTQASTVKVVNTSVAQVSKIEKHGTGTDYVFGKFTVTSKKVGTTKIVITLSDGLSKEFNLVVVSSLEELEIKLGETVANGEIVESDIIPNKSITDTVVKGDGSDAVVALNELTIANTGSGIQLIKTAKPSTAQYYLQYSFVDGYVKNETNLWDNENIVWEDSSDVLNVAHLQNYSIIEAKNASIQESVLIRIAVYSMGADGKYSTEPVGYFYYLVNFFIPTERLEISSAVNTLLTYETLGDKNAEKSKTEISVIVDPVVNGLNPTYLQDLLFYVNGKEIGKLFNLENLTYLSADGAITANPSNASLKIAKEFDEEKNTFNLTVQALNSKESNYVFAFVLSEVNPSRKFTAISRIFVEDAVEITNMEFVNANEENPVEINNIVDQNNLPTEEFFELELVCNIFSKNGKEITNKNLEIEFDWDYLSTGKDYYTDATGQHKFVSIYENEDGKLVLRIVRYANDNGNFVTFGGKGLITIYPQSNYFNSTFGWNGEEPIVMIPITVADGKFEGSALKISTEADFELLKKYPTSHFVLENNLEILNFESVEEFGGVLNGKGNAITVNKPLFEKLSANAVVKNLNIVSKIEGTTGCSTEIEGKTYLGVLANVNNGTIENVVNDAESNLTNASANYVGGLVGLNNGTIKVTNGVHNYLVNISAENGTVVGGIAGKNNGTISKYRFIGTIKINNVEQLANIIGENNGIIENAPEITEVSSFEFGFGANVLNNGENTAVVYRFNVVSGTELTEKQKYSLNAKNLVNLNDFMSIKINGESNCVNILETFKLTSNNENVVEVSNGKINLVGKGKAEITISPLNGTAESQTLIVYVINPIDEIQIFEGQSQLSESEIENEDVVEIIKDKDNYFSINISNKIVLNNQEFTLETNAVAFEINANGEFSVSGTTPGAEKGKFALGTINLQTTGTEYSGKYSLNVSLSLQTAVNQSLGNITSEDIEKINSILNGEKFSTTRTFTVLQKATRILTSISKAEIDPSNVVKVSVELQTNNSNDNIILEIFGENGIVWSNKQGNVTNKGIFAVEGFGGSVSNGKLTNTILISIQDNYRSQIKETTTYKVVVTDSSATVSAELTLVVNPQEIISVTYAHYNRADLSQDNAFIVQDQPSSILVPGDSGLLSISLYPTYSNFTKIVLTSELVGNDQYVLMEQMYQTTNDVYLPVSSTTGYDSVREGNVLTINKLSNDGKVYVRTKILDSVEEGMYFPINILIYSTDENGKEVIVKSETITLLSEVVTKAGITIDGKKQATLVRGKVYPIEVTVLENQELASYTTVDFNKGKSSNDFVSININKSNYKLENGKKIYSGTVAIGLDTEIEGDGVFQIQTVVNKVINGRIETSTDSIKLNVVDFLVEGVGIKGNASGDNVFNSPMAIEKDLTFEFVLSATPELTNINNKASIERIEKAKQDFLNNMALKQYSINSQENGKSLVYSYTINTYREFFSNSNKSIANNIFYSSDLTPYVNSSELGYQDNQIFNLSWKENQDAKTVTILGKRVGSLNMTVQIPYRLPGATEDEIVSYEFVINVQVWADEENVTPIENEEQFIKYLTYEGEDYSQTNFILMNDIVLENYTPISSTNFASLDGNNKIITIKNFNQEINSSTLNLGLFINVSKEATIKNLAVDYSKLEEIVVDETKISNVNVAGIAVNNSGIIYNCEVVSLDKSQVYSNGGIKVYFSSTNKEQPKQDKTKVQVAGFVVENKASGSITNSRVGGKNTFTQVEYDNGQIVENNYSYGEFNLVGQGDVAGFVLKNNGAIASSYFANGTIINKTTSGALNATAGFAAYNNQSALIFGSYSEGVKLSSDHIYITGGGIVAQGTSAGFVYENDGIINDCYSNIRLAGNSTGRIVSGFVYNNKENAEISRCYSASTIVGQLTTQMPFSGKNAREESMQNSKAGLQNCYYLVTRKDTQSVLEETYNTGAISLLVARLQESYFYGFAMTEENDSNNGVWNWNVVPQLVSANQIAISVRRVVKDYGSTVGKRTEVYPYLNGYEYGSINNPIIIRSADEYNRVFGQETNLIEGAYYAISQMYNKKQAIVFGSYRLVNSIDFNKLTNIENIKVSSSIMTLAKDGSYLGTFDGNGLNIQNVEISLNNQTSVGLFSKITGAGTFKNVNITVKNISTGTSGVYAGAVAGLVQNSSLANIIVSPTTTEGEDRSKISGQNIVGGVAGAIVGNSKISNLFSSISVVSGHSNAESNIDGYVAIVRNNLRAVGGLVTDLNKNWSFAGGVVGVLDIYQSIGDSRAPSTPNAQKLSYTGENVSVQGGFVGGVAGYVGKSTYVKDASFILSGTELTLNQRLITYGNTIGGIVGVSYGELFELKIEHESEIQIKIENNVEGYYNSSAKVFRGNENLFNTTSLEGNLYAGGLVGQMKAGDLTVSYSKIDVVLPIKDNKENPVSSIVGGLIGLNQSNTHFYELYAFGNVDANVAGGLIGQNQGNIEFEKCVAINFFSKDNSMFDEALTKQVKGVASLVAINNEGGEISIIADVYVNKFEIKDGQTLPVVLNYSFNDDSNKKLYDLTLDMTEYRGAMLDGGVINRMFIGSGWDPMLWAVTEKEVLPELTYGLSETVLYIEKSEDLIKLKNYNRADCVVIFGDDPATEFNPYENQDAKGSLDKNNKVIILNINLVSNKINQADGAYFESFKGIMYGERSSLEYTSEAKNVNNIWTYQINGMETSLFKEVQGGRIDGISFGNSNSSPAQIGQPILAQTIEDETKLYNLSFAYYNLNSNSTENAGIVANKMLNIDTICNLTIENCSITTNCAVRVGAVAGLIQNEKKATNLTNINVSLSGINATGATYVGGMFGQIITSGVASALGFRLKNGSVKITNGIVAGQMKVLKNNDEFFNNLTDEEKKFYTTNSYFVGGIAGSFKNALSTEQVGVSINGIIMTKHNDETNETTTYVGGFIGEAGSQTISFVNPQNTNFFNLASTGTIDIQTQSATLFAGLMFGEVGDGVSISGGDAKLSGAITNKGNSAIANVGGIAGKVNGNASVTANSITINEKVVAGEPKAGSEETTQQYFNITGTSTKDNQTNVGGAFGHVVGNLQINKITIDSVATETKDENNNEVNDGNITVSVSGSGVANVGGVAGLVQGTITLGTSATKDKEVVVNGDINFDGASVQANVGGVVGQNNQQGSVTINNAEYNGFITVNSSSSIVGGIAGNLTAKKFEIKNSKSTGEIEVSNASTVGGIVGQIADGGTNNGLKLENNIVLSNIKINSATETISVGGVAGGTADGTISSNKVGGNIVFGDMSGKSVNVGGVVGSISSGEVSGNYAWGNVEIKEGSLLSNNDFAITSLNAGGIVGNITDKITLTSNYSLTSLYITKRGQTHNVNALVGSGETTIDKSKPNYYCHQINLATDTYGTNLYYKTSKENVEAILTKGNGVFKDFVGEAGTKLKPSQFDASQPTDKGKYYYISSGIVLGDASAGKTIAGHLVGDGNMISYTGARTYVGGISPFNEITGYVSGIKMNFVSTSEGATYGRVTANTDGPPNGFANLNSGIIFAILVEAKGYSNSNYFGNVNFSINSGLVATNSGIIADSGVVLNVKSAYAGVVGANSGVIENTYVTGTVHKGAQIAFNGAGGTSIVLNSYTAIKGATTNTFAGTFVGTKTEKVYYDSVALEQTGTSGTAKTTDNMSFNSTKENKDQTKFYGESTNWTQSSTINFGYPYLGEGSYAGFGYLGYDSGNGSDKAIQIPHVGKLQQLLTWVDGSNNSGAKNLEKDYILLSDIVLTRTQFAGSAVDSNSKTFDGNGYHISNIPSINGDSNLGFFGTNSGTIKNLGLIYENDATVTHNDPSTGSVGGLVGNNSGIIDNVAVSGKVSGGANTGGIAGTNSGTIKNVVFYGSVTGVEGVSSTGGIVGFASGSWATIKGAINYGNISKGTNVGGIVGYTEGSIGELFNSNYGCYNYGEIFKGEYVGGIVGKATNSVSLIKDSTNYGIVSTGTYIGGIAGYTTANVLSSKNYAEITDGKYIGGIAGQTAGTVSNCENYGNITTGTDGATASGIGNAGTNSGELVFETVQNGIYKIVKNSGENKEKTLYADEINWAITDYGISRPNLIKAFKDGSDQLGDDTLDIYYKTPLNDYYLKVKVSEWKWAGDVNNGGRLRLREVELVKISNNTEEKVVDFYDGGNDGTLMDAPPYNRENGTFKFEFIQANQTNTIKFFLETQRSGSTAAYLKISAYVNLISTNKNLFTSNLNYGSTTLSEVKSNQYLYTTEQGDIVLINKRDFANANLILQSGTTTYQLPYQNNASGAFQGAQFNLPGDNKLEIKDGASYSGSVNINQSVKTGDVTWRISGSTGREVYFGYSKTGSDELKTIGLGVAWHEDANFRKYITIGDTGLTATITKVENSLSLYVVITQKGTTSAQGDTNLWSNNVSEPNKETVNGTTNYLVYTAEQFAWAANKAKTEELNIILMKDIDLREYRWDITGYEKNLKINYNGGHKIYFN